MSETLRVNLNISHHRIVEKIGAGGMGEDLNHEEHEVHTKIFFN